MVGLGERVPNHGGRGREGLEFGFDFDKRAEGGRDLRFG